MHLTEFDNYLCSQVSLELKLPTTNDIGAGRSSTGSKIMFQFPPTIPSDGKSAEWEEINVRTYEPLALYMGNNARKFELKWTYIVTGKSSPNGGPWTAKYISEMVKKVRGHFYNVMGSDVVVLFSAYDVIGSMSAKTPPFSFRAESMNATQSETMISDGPNGFIYPLRTDITMSMKMWTTLQDENSAKRANLGNGDKLAAANNLGDKAVHKIQRLQAKPDKVEWL